MPALSTRLPLRLRRFARSFVFAWLALGLGSKLAGQPVAAPTAELARVDSNRVDFDRDVRPILADACYACHGPDEGDRQADLRIDTRAGLNALRGERAVVDRGVPQRGLIWERLHAEDAEARMPPATSGRALSDAQLAILERWLQDGAEWRPHWAFEVPRKQPLPSSDREWSRGAIDRFIEHRLRRELLEPSPPASRLTWLRRVTLDLTGLPPTPTEVAAFEADDAPDARERVVDRLLASPHLGERLAIDWLDAARYADTSGYQNDGPRHMWRWRDWVMDAFNQGMALDDFTRQQIAGDLLPDATVAQRVATGFQRNHRGNAEGGIIPEEFAVEYVVDRVETTAAVWLGLTVGCARCHDHKYDPISQREFYQLFAFFNNVPEHGRAIKEGNSPPYIAWPTDAQQRELTRVAQQLAKAERDWLSRQAELTAARQAWEDSPGDPETLDARPDGPRWAPPADAAWSWEAPADSVGTSELPRGVVDRAAVGRGLWLDGTQAVEAAEAGQFGYRDRFTLTAWIRPDRHSGTIASRMVDEPQGEGYSWTLRNGHLQLNLVKRWLDDAIRVETELPIAALADESNNASNETRQWLHVAATYDGSRRAAGIQLYVNGERQPTRVLLDQINQSFASTEPFRWGAGHGVDGRYRGGLDEGAIHARVLESEEIRALAATGSVGEIVAIPARERTAAQQAQLEAWYLQHAAPAATRESHALWRQARETHRQLVDALPTVMVMEEQATPRPAHVLLRGQYDQPGAAVEPGVPAVLPPLPSRAEISVAAPHARPNRLDLAEWLVSPDQPLTSRVLVNRYWQLLFGRGLVRSPEDFGLQGERPDHAELLDWLAVDLREGGWELKRLLRRIVLSSTYEQSSQGSRALWERDPENRLLARQSRVRLPAELIRDQALAAAGVLQRRIGGPSFKTYQPEGLWSEIATDKEYVRESGEELYRRSVYIYWKRTIGPPLMQTFDAPARESCTLRRTPTNTPLQALLTMNETGFQEAARLLAERVLGEGGATDTERLDLLVRLCLARAPLAEERAILQRSLDRARQRYASDEPAARAATTLGDSTPDPRWPAAELAAYTTVSSLVLNLDETISRE